MGESESGDSICREFIGRISVDRSVIIMTRNQRMDTCPFFNYIVYRE